MSEYESSLSVEASVHGEVEGFACSAAFEASAGFDSFAKEVAETDSERIEMTSYCFTSVAGLREDAAAVLKPTVYLKEVASELKTVSCLVNASIVNESHAPLVARAKNARGHQLDPRLTRSHRDYLLSVCAHPDLSPLDSS